VRKVADQAYWSPFDGPPDSQEYNLRVALLKKPTRPGIWTKLHRSTDSDLKKYCQKFFPAIVTFLDPEVSITYNIKKLPSSEYKVKFYHHQHNDIPVDVLECAKTRGEHTVTYHMAETNTDDCVFNLAKAQYIKSTPEETMQELLEKGLITRESMENHHNIVIPLIPNTFKVFDKLCYIEPAKKL